MSGLQCPKRLWLEINQPELMQFTDRTEQSFKAGHEVGSVAQRLNPDGVLISHVGDLSSALAETAHLLSQSGDAVLFEPAFQHGGVLVRADVLSHRGDGVHLVEVKSSTKAKPHYFNDIAIQAWVIGGSGQSFHTAQLWHIDNSFVYPGNGDYRGLFANVDVTEEINQLKHQVPEWVAGCQKVLSGPQPQIEVGKQCTDPNECPFLSHCAPAETDYPVSILPYGGALAGKLQTQGYKDLREVPQESLSSERYLRVWRASRTGLAELDQEAARELAGLPYPRYYLDFETMQFAVPIWPGTRPYEQLPFQWSCHVEYSSEKLDHREFLDTEGNAPMRQFIETLITALESNGPILVYSSFERTVLKTLVERFPDLHAQIEGIINRLVDLYPITKSHYYHPAMKGSWSIKAVLPTIAPELAYDTLGEVQDGGGAQDAYREIIAHDTPDKRRKQVADDLRAYCCRDTLAMVEVARFFEGRRQA